MRSRPILTALLAATAFSPPTIQSSIIKTDSVTSTSCLPISRRLSSVTILPRMHRPRPDEVSLSPAALPDPNVSTSNNITKGNGSTSAIPHAMPSPPAWVLTLEDLLTVIFRIVITVLTLFNVNITWRIHANQDARPRQLGHAWAGVRLEIV